MEALPPPDAFVDGRWVAGTKRFPVRNPFDGTEIAQVTDSDDALVDAAIEAASRAFVTWKRRPGPERGKLLAQVAARMLADEKRLAEICTRENGKPLKESAAEVRYAAGFLSWFAGEAERAYGDTIPSNNVHQRIVVTREPIGPAGLITPWNFPYAMLTRKLGAALAAGCTVVAKPAELTPLSALALAQICEAVGIPPGVVNIVPSAHGSHVGGRLVAAPRLPKISFTGSTEVGKVIMRGAAEGVKRISLELGGNAPFVVLADADLDAAVAGAMVAKFRNTGQSCVAANRFIVEQPVAEQFAAKLCAAIEKLVVGDGMDPTVDIGPLIDDAAVAKVKRLTDDAIAKGARVLLGVSPPGTTRLIAPIVLAGITPEMSLWREEAFGPIVSLRTATSEADAIAQANDTEYGLVAYLYTRDGAKQWRVAEALEAGMVGINEGLVSTPQAPFGGVKQSGLGREGSHYGLDDYTNLKYLSIRIG